MSNLSHIFLSKSVDTNQVTSQGELSNMKTRLLTIAVSTIALLTMQFATLTMASAATNTDLSIEATRVYSNQGLELTVCNEGSTAVKEIVFSISSTNFEYDSTWFIFPDTTATDDGIYDINTSTWTGLLDGGECIKVVLAGNETGNIGDVVTSGASIVSSVHDADDAVNVDPNSANDSSTANPYTIGLLPDIKTEARLVTTGVIEESDNVDFEISITNIGDGLYNSAGGGQYQFVLPEGSTFVGVTDGDESDVIGASTSNCFNFGRLGIEVPVPGTDYFFGRQIVICPIDFGGNNIPANSPTYTFTVTVTAGASFAAGEADVLGMFNGNDTGTMDIHSKVMTGIQLYDTLEAEPNNNIAFLSYDPTALNATSTLCPGQSAVSTDGTGCFRISFNKDIYEPSFDISDIVVTGSGTVSSLTKVGTNLWEVSITGIARNGTATISLNLGGIVDYSAVENGTQVLGVNSIRFADESTGDSESTLDSETASAAGTLPATGSNISDLLTPMLLLLLGMGLAIAGRKKKVIA